MRESTPVASAVHEVAHAAGLRVAHDRDATEHTALVCGMNLSLIGGILEGHAISSLTARLAPAPGLCCVKVEPSPTGAPTA